MTQSIPRIPLAEFLTQPNIEASPAWELIDGRAVQKPMPTLFHSRLQRNLVNYINDRTDAPWPLGHATRMEPLRERCEAVQELRCIIPPYSPVPDIAIVGYDHLPDHDGPVDGAPDWLIEIRSPDQSTLNLQNKILHCLSNGTQLAWLIDFARQQIWVWQGDDLPIIFSGEDILPSLGILPELTVNGVMAMTRRS
ncbi:Uma2 family endonuclease [Moorena sp. SIO4G3]|uniref:Uma2 family endonuclease n=1 Tax=Moorena sp. SIO4G3 TaxID=2607821 RepID=UPI00142A6D41|nr:Uma2 family endonuclease [Moorena sp. SIO4G3]NEO81667.1 Uma2 family endonuclease [Moorena sp. SIO4G3]